MVKDAEISSTALNENTNNSYVKREGLIDVLRSPVLLKRLVIMIAAWYIITDFHITFLYGFNNVTMANKGSVALWATTVLHFPATTCLAIFSSTTNSACKFRSTLCFFINFNWPKLDFLKW